MILVCGGAGYIGSHMARELVRRGEETAILDNLATGRREAAPPEAKFYRGDIRDERLLDRIFGENRIEAVVHFAGLSLVGESAARPLEYYDVNLGGGRALLSAMVRHDIDSLVFSSSASVYGAPDGSAPLRETDPTVPINPYGETKLAFEKMLGHTRAAGGPRFVSLRYFNAAGADTDGLIGEDHRPESHLIPLALLTALGRREKLAIFGLDYDTPDGSCVRDYVHVLDLVEAHFLALDLLRRGDRGGVFNLGGGRGVSVLEIINAAERATGSAIPTEAGPRRPGDPPCLTADITKAERELGWRPRRADIDDIVASAWRWRRTHPDGFGE